MPYMVSNTCYPDSATALDAWLSAFPSPPDSSGVIWFPVSSSISVEGVISATLQNSLSGGASVTVPSSVVLQSCTAQTSSFVLDKMPVQDILFAAVLCVAAFFGFLAGRAR